jgi:hypothetical protein
MEPAVPWKAAMKPRLPTGLGKRSPHHHPRFPQLPQPLLLATQQTEPMAEAEATTLRLTRSTINLQGGDF